MITDVSQTTTVIGRDRLLMAWWAFPGRNCSDKEWEAWIAQINEAIDAAQREERTKYVEDEVDEELNHFRERRPFKERKP